MSPLLEIRPSTPDEVALLEKRRNKVHKQIGPRPENTELFEGIRTQISETGSVTLEYDLGDWVEANRTANRVRAAFQRVGTEVDISIENVRGQRTKLIIGLRAVG